MIAVVSRNHVWRWVLIRMIPVNASSFISNHGTCINLRSCIFKLLKFPKLVIWWKISIYIVAFFIIFSPHFILFSYIIVLDLPNSLVILAFKVVSFSFLFFGIGVLVRKYILIKDFGDAIRFIISHCFYVPGTLLEVVYHGHLWFLNLLSKLINKIKFD